MNSQFEFSAANQQVFRKILQRYPVKRAALLPTLRLVQEQNDFIPPEAEAYVAQLLDVPLVDVREVLMFYSLFHRRRPGKHHIRLCCNLSCWLRGSSRIRAHLTQKLGVDSGETTRDSSFSWEAVADCMGACEIAPMLQLDEDYHGNLTPAEVDRILESLL